MSDLALPSPIRCSAERQGSKMGHWTKHGVRLPAIEFDGDSIVFEVTRLRTEDMLELSKFYDKTKGAMVFGSPAEVCTVAAAILPKYIKSIDGMTADGAPVTVELFETMVSEFYFVPLIGALLAHLITVSTVGAQEKN